TTNAVFTVTLNALNPVSTACGPVTVNYATRNNSAASGSDYTATSGTVSFNAGETTKTFTVPVAADCNAEGTEAFIVDLSSPFGTTISDGFALGTITTDDDRSVSIADVTVVEGEGGGTTNAVFTVTLNALNPVSTACGPVTVNYATRNNSAASGSDYTATSGTVSFNAGETTKTFTVPVAADCNAEGTEAFIVDLSSPIGATISDGFALGTITTDDDRSVSIADVTVVEGEGGGTTNAVFTVTLNALNPVSTACGPVTVDYATRNNSAASGSDYTATSGTVSFNAGETTKTFTVPVAADCNAEGTEAFIVDLSSPFGTTISDGFALGTITTDDDRSVSIADVTVVEGEGGGTTNAVFTVTLNALNPVSTACGPVTVNYATRNNSAASGSDYTATSGTVSFNAGETTKTFTVPVAADCNAEGTEAFIVDLSSPFGTTISDGFALGTITTDDDRSVSIADVTIMEPTTGTADAVFTVTLNALN